MQRTGLRHLPFCLCCGIRDILVRIRIRIRIRLHLHHFSQVKIIKKSQCSRKQGLSYYFCLMTEGSGAGSGSGSIPCTTGSGSERQKKNTYPDPKPQNCILRYRYLFYQSSVKLTSFINFIPTFPSFQLSSRLSSRGSLDLRVTEVVSLAPHNPHNQEISVVLERSPQQTPARPAHGSLERNEETSGRPVQGILERSREMGRFDGKADSQELAEVRYVTLRYGTVRFGILRCSAVGTVQKVTFTFIFGLKFLFSGHEPIYFIEK
jgi:hypothetical protein